MIRLIYLVVLLTVASAALADKTLTGFYDGTTGRALTAGDLASRLSAADVILLGEIHTDAGAHRKQIDVIRQIAVFRPEANRVLSLEEFNRDQQDILDSWVAGELSAEQLKAERRFVNLTVKENWLDWNLPKLEAGRDSGYRLLAANAPLKYSRLARNHGCNDLPELTEPELALFDCPQAPLDAEYAERFSATLKRVSARGEGTGLKPIEDEQAQQLFVAHRVWDATMAQSIVDARAAGADVVVHIVGNFHIDFDGGLLDELRARDPDAELLTITFMRRRKPANHRLAAPDAGRADIVVYTR